MHTISLFLSFIISSVLPTSKDSSNLETKTVQKTKHTVVEYQVKPGTDIKNGFYNVKYDGETMIKGYYTSDKESGTWAYYYCKDTLKTTGGYSEGQKTGVWTSYCRDGGISTKAIYIEGERSDEYLKNYPDGTIKEESTPGIVKHYFENGKVSTEIHMKEGKQNGQAKRYYENGMLKESRFMKNGERDSTYLYYYEDGTVWEHIIYKQGGVWNVLAYNTADGKPLNCCTIKDGNGIMRFYDLDGKITEEAEYRNTQKNGSFKRFGKSGILTEGCFTDNQETGTWKFYNNNGLPTRECNFILGKEEGKAIYYYSSGKIKSVGMKKAGNMDGEWTSYDSEGKISSIVNYMNDTLEGLARNFYHGKLNEAGKYLHGQKDGVWVRYDNKEKPVFKEEFTFKPAEKTEKKASHIMHENDQSNINDQKVPEFPGGENALMHYLGTTITYPGDSKDNGIQGTVVLTFIVTSYGEVTDIRIIKSVAKDIDKESLRVVNSMSRWTPGTQNDIPVNVQYNLPVSFVLR